MPYIELLVTRSMFTVIKTAIAQASLTDANEKDVGDIVVSELKTFPLYCSCSFFFKRILILTYDTHAVCNSYNFGNSNPWKRPRDSLVRLEKGPWVTKKQPEKITENFTLLINAGPRLNAGLV